MSDIWTMMWKESKDLVFQGGRQAWIRPLLFIAILGIALPGPQGQSWLTFSPIMLLLSLYIPFMFTVSYIGDAIAGERERHTLETLLASRISDLSILLGKVIVTTLYAWGMALTGLLLGFVVANLSSGSQNWNFYSPSWVFFDVLVLNFLTSLLSASGGVLVSLKAATVRQAQQSMTLFTIVLGIAAVLAVRTLPVKMLTSMTPSQILLGLMAVLAVFDAILLAVSLATFQRSRLILS